MSRAKTNRLAVPQPGNAPSPAAVNGGKAFTALSNHAQANQTATSGTGTVTAGSLYATGLSFTPKVSGKVLLQWSSAGTGASATASGTFTPAIGGQTGPAISAGAAGDGSHTISAGGSCILSGLVVGTPVTANVSYTAVNGYTQGAFGDLVVIELPA